MSISVSTDHHTKFLVDNGAKVSIINEETINKFNFKPRIRPSTTKLVAFTGNQIASTGIANIHLRYKSKPIRNFPFHIVPKGDNVLGVDLFKTLGFKIADFENKQIAKVDATTFERATSNSQNSNFKNSTSNFKNSTSNFKNSTSNFENSSSNSKIQIRSQKSRLRTAKIQLRASKIQLRTSKIQKRRTMVNGHRWI